MTASRPRTGAAVLGGVVLVGSVLAGCASQADTEAPTQSEASSSAIAPGAAAEDALQAAVWLTIVNGTGEPLALDATTNCDDEDVRTLPAGGQWEGTGTCSRSPDIFGTIGTMNFSAKPSSLVFGACVWPKASNAAGDPYLSGSGESSSGCAASATVVGDQPANDSRFHWTITVNG